MENNGKVGIIHEIGDMGLGFQELTDKEQLQVNKDTKAKEENK